MMENQNPSQAVGNPYPTSKSLDDRAAESLASKLPMAPSRSEQVRQDIKNGAKSRFVSVVSGSIDDCTKQIVEDLDKLSKEIESIRERVARNSEAAKAGIAQLLELGSEAAVFADSVRQKLGSVLKGAEAAMTGTSRD